MMRSILQSVGVCFAILAVVAAGAMPAHAARNKSKQPDENRKYAAIVVDASTGQVLMADNPDKQLHPASLTKMMTLLLAFDALSSGQIGHQDFIRVSSKAAAQSPSKLGIPAGGRLRVDDAIRALSVKSANDIAVAMAEALGGTESRFAQKMNARAREIGMTRTHFVNASGLHNSFQVSTARDMSVLARYIIATYPSYYRYFGLKSFNYGGRSHANHNKLMNSYAGMDGMKTGYIGASGFNLVASAKRDGRRLIGVVFGGRTSNSRNVHMAKILDTAFARPGPLPKPDTNRYVAAAPSRDVSVAKGVAEMAPGAGRTTAAVHVQPPRRAVQLAAIPVRKPDRAEVGSTPGTDPRWWSVQIGAYRNRDATDRALYNAGQRLPSSLAHATPVVAPLKSIENGWMFRARLSNLSSSDAARVCQILSGCLVLPPEAN
jgi:D-alanyl-D-alanine carboxypeptidase